LDNCKFKKQKLSIGVRAANASNKRWDMKGIMTFLLVLLSTHVGTVGAQLLEQIENYERRIDEQQRQLDAMRDELEALKKMAGMQRAASEALEPTSAQVADVVEEDAGHKSFVVRRGENGVFTLGGRLHRVFMYADDGASSDIFFMDSGQAPTMLRADISSRMSSDWTLSGAFEVGIQSNPAARVSQDDPNPGTDITVRESDLELKSDSYGTFSFGRGFSATWVVPEIDLSGTTPSAFLAVGNLAPGMKFVDRTTNELSSITVSQHFADTERLLLVDRFRYDSPSFGGGYQLSGTVAADARWDAALRYYPSNDDWTIRAAVTYQHKPFQDIDDRYDIGFAARHNATGLNINAGLVVGEARDGRDAATYIVKAGWLTNLNSLGYTAFSADFASGSNARLADDESESIGIFVQQRLESVGLDLYGGFRRYEVERPDIDLRPMNILALGANFTF
jgi:hypothetical protein